MTRPRNALRLILPLLLCHGATSRVIDVVDHGAVGDGVADDTSPIADALSAAAASAGPASPATVLFPRGRTFLTGPINVTSSHTTLRVDGTLRAISGNNTKGGEEYVRIKWPRLPPLPGYGTSEDGAYLQFQSFLYGTGLTNVRITGTGVVDAQGDWWWANQRNRTLIPAGRPNLLQLVNCTGVVLDGVTLRDSPFWCVHPVNCTDVHIHHTTIRSRMYAPNSDGIDPDSCRNVMIEHNDVSVGDDHIAIKAGRCGDPTAPNDCRDPKFSGGQYYRTENVTVRNNVFRIGMGIAVGSETSGTVRNVDIHDNVVGLCDAGHCLDTCCGWGPALHLKTTPTRGGVVENIVFRNNTVYNSTSFIMLEMDYQTGKGNVVPVDYRPTAVRNVTFANNRALGRAVGASFGCAEGDPCEGIVVVNNTIRNAIEGSSPWGCRFVRTYEVGGNWPPGLEECMEGSMNGTGSVLPPSSADEKIAAIRLWQEYSRL